MKVLKLAQGIEICDLNPHNFALKNDYMNNILSCGLLLSEAIYRNGTVEDVNVTRGFLSNSYIADNLAVTAGKSIDVLMQHSRGNAIEITFKDFNIDSAIELCKDIIEVSKANDEYCKCIIYSGRNKIGVYFESKEFAIDIITNTNEKRSVYKA